VVALFSNFWGSLEAEESFCMCLIYVWHKSLTAVITSEFFWPGFHMHKQKCEHQFVSRPQNWTDTHSCSN